MGKLNCQDNPPLIPLGCWSRRICSSFVVGFDKLGSGGVGSSK